MNPPAQDHAPLVLLPGTLCDARVFQPVLERIGCAATIPAMTGETSAPAMAQRLLSILPERFSLGGFSLGGIVALEMIAQAPERIDRLCLIDTTARPDPESNWTKRRNAVSRARTLGLDRYVSDKLWSLYVSGDSAGDEAKRAMIAAMSVALGLEAFQTQSEIAIQRADSRPRLAAIRAPTLVICGEDEKLCPVEAHEEMANLIPGARLVVIKAAGHFALIEQPDAVAAAMRDWLGQPAAARQDFSRQRVA